MKKLIALFAVLFSILLISNKVYACGGQYESPCQSYSITVDKTVGIPGNSTDATSYQYVDNLGPSDAKFNPNQYVFFRINVKNTSTTTLGGMTITDTLPAYLNPISGPGTFNSSNRTITWDGGFFDVNQTKTYYLEAQVVGQNNLPADQSIVCVTNYAQATSNNISGSDSSQLCIQKQVTNVVTVPSTGPEFGYILVAGEIALAGMGIYLKKKV